MIWFRVFLATFLTVTLLSVSTAVGFAQSSSTGGPPTYSRSSDCKDADLNESNCSIISYLKVAIGVLSAVSAFAIIGSVIFAGIQYSMAGGDTSKVSAAKGRIQNAMIALFFLVFGVAILNFIVPGGLV